MNNPGTELSDSISLLRHSELFALLDADELSWVARHAETRTLESGSILFAAGDRATCFHIVQHGIVGIYRRNDHGALVEMARFEAGDVVGDFDFSRQSMFDAQARVDEAATILTFPGFGLTMDDLARDQPRSAARILLRSVAMISSRVRSTQSLISENAPWVRELRRQMYTDAATGLWTRSFLDDELPGLIEAPTVLVFIKPDHFKELCDTWGHGAGDLAMARIAGILKDESRFRRPAWAIRLRSNETALVVSGGQATEAMDLAAGISGALSLIDISELTAGRPFHFTATMSVAVWPRDGRDFKALVEAGYSSMMMAWQAGGNRIVQSAVNQAGNGSGGDTPTGGIPSGGEQDGGTA